MKKNDYKLLGTILGIAVLLLLGRSLKEDGKANIIQVEVNGVLRGEYVLSEDREIDINGTNRLVIKNGKADVIDAKCPDKICVKQKPISKSGESIVCLPNKVIITVVEGKENELDAVVK
ncbi:NusG domain II-containing protein [Faecalimonas sp.]